MDKKLFNDLVESMNQMVAIEKGGLSVPDENIHYHRLPDVKNLRETFGLKQSEFAEVIGVFCVSNSKLGTTTPHSFWFITETT